MGLYSWRGQGWSPLLFAVGVSRQCTFTPDCGARSVVGGRHHVLPHVYKNIRRALLYRFPYSLFFVLDGETVLIIACFHASRNPDRWQSCI